MQSEKLKDAERLIRSMLDLFNMLDTCQVDQGKLTRDHLNQWGRRWLDNPDTRPAEPVLVKPIEELED